MRNLLLALPPVVVTVVLAFVSGAEIAGAHVLTMGEARSVPEAIAMRDYAGAARLIEAGADAREIGLIRAGVLSDRPILATPLEAAVLVDARPMLDFLLSRGADLSGDLNCLAADVGASAVRLHPGREQTCRAGDALQAVIARP